MFECQNCEATFDIPEEIDNELVCPYCKSSDIIGEDIEEMNSKYGGKLYYVYFKEYDTGKTYRTCLSPSYRNYKNWLSLMNNYNDKVVEVENVRVNSKGLIDADAMPKIIISEREKSYE